MTPKGHPEPRYLRALTNRCRLLRSSICSSGRNNKGPCYQFGSKVPQACLGAVTSSARTAPRAGHCQLPPTETTTGAREVLGWELFELLEPPCPGPGALSATLYSPILSGVVSESCNCKKPAAPSDF
ncbi:hypothetical protein MN608_02022 [Microdochium nivale]|nr:hypothetical protein MN608_02022 [Microdochium nivale]